MTTKDNLEKIIINPVNQPDSKSNIIPENEKKSDHIALQDKCKASSILPIQDFSSKKHLGSEHTIAILENKYKKFNFDYFNSGRAGNFNEKDPYHWFYLTPKNFKINAEYFIRLFDSSMILPMQYNKTYLINTLQNYQKDITLNHCTKELYRVIECMINPNLRLFTKRLLPMDTRDHFRIKRNLYTHLFNFTLCLHLNKKALSECTPNPADIFTYKEIYNIIQDFNVISLIRKYTANHETSYKLEKILINFMEKNMSNHELNLDIVEEYRELLLSTNFHWRNINKPILSLKKTRCTTNERLEVINLLFAIIAISMLAQHKDLKTILHLYYDPEDS